MKTKNILITSVAILATIGLYAAPQIEIDTVRVTDKNNAADTAANGGAEGLGAVNNDFSIGTTAVTTTQYVAFLNAVATDAQRQRTCLYS